MSNYCMGPRDMEQPEKMVVFYCLFVGLSLVFGQQKVFYRLSDPMTTFRYRKTVIRPSGSAASCALACSSDYKNCNSFIYIMDTGLCRCGGWGWIKKKAPFRNVSNEQVFWAPKCDIVDSYRLESDEMETVCLRFSVQPENYTNAKDYCTERGLQLVTLKTPQKLTFFKGIASHYFVDTVWIGLDDLDKEGDFRWADDNTPLQNLFVFRASNSSQQPNNYRDAHYDQDCVTYTQSIWYFNDNYCAYPKHIVCEAVIA